MAAACTTICSIQATTHFQKYLDLRPKDKEIWAAVSTSHARFREWEEAIACQRKALALDPDNKKFAETLGLHLGMAGRMDESFTCLRGVVGEAAAHGLVAEMLHHVGKDDAARQHAELALRSDPNLRSAQDVIADLDGAKPASEPAATPVAAGQ